MIRLFYGALGALVLVACQPKLSPRTARQISSLVIVADASTSSGDPSAASVKDLRCPEVVGSIRQALSASPRRIDVLVLATGGKETSFEPRVLLPWLRYEPKVRLFGQTPSKQDHEQAFFKTIAERCYATLKEENSSPLVAAISRGTLSLASHCEDITPLREVCSSRQLVVLSDLRENANAGVKQRLLIVSHLLQQGRPIPPRPSTVPLISLTAISASLCGLGEHVERRQGADAVPVSGEALLVVWREVLGTSPTFSAGCPRERLHIAEVSPGAGGER